eukprot:CAMPEP_0113550906 /NCGR_PEP_ID=MMETSP0015_2-20120614/14235_1 /TAXON_ID=2838 /ORGANISM="Odontella" /LENGTH=138 /DNA_ID=CAMNT_0000451751 /DNA_START=145 /DNA_END=558 /DNA_ORIENTATION=- /assembly_acc=CAM_ASM_000160
MIRLEANDNEMPTVLVDSAVATGSSVAFSLDLKDNGLRDDGSAGDKQEKRVKQRQQQLHPLERTSMFWGESVTGISDMNVCREFDDIAVCIVNEMQTIGLIAALLSSWGATVYAGEAHPGGGLCYGAPMVKASLVSFW